MRDTRSLAKSFKKCRTRLTGTWRQSYHSAIFFVLLVKSVSAGEFAVTTQRYDNARSGQNLSETILNTSNVSPATFGKVFTRAVDDEVYAQPLYVPNVNVSGRGLRNVLYVATVSGTIYAFDADDPGAAAPLWRVRLGFGAGLRPVNNVDVGYGCWDEQDRPGYRDFSGNIGLVGTPVIDLGSRTLYAVIRTRERSRINRLAVRFLSLASRTTRSISRTLRFGTSATNLANRTLDSIAGGLEQLLQAREDHDFVQRLHALDITTGAERPNSPASITATVQSSQGIVSFNPRTQNQRGALLLANGLVYVTWAAHCDLKPYHGWIMAYDKVSLRQKVVKTTTPDGTGGGIWQSGSGPSADGFGDIYFAVGNGTVTAPTGGKDYGNAFLKLSPSGEVLDWFIPSNYKQRNKVDADLGSAGVLLIPDTNLLVSGGKIGFLFVLDRNNFGRFQRGSDDHIVQEFFAGGPLFSTPTYWNGPGGPYVYTWCSWDSGRQWRLEGNRLVNVSASKTSMIANGRPGGMLAISANGTSSGTGILWASLGSGDAMEKAVPGVLRAFDASDLGHELWDSTQNGGRDDVGSFAKFNTPTIANGKVYLATFSHQVVVYALRSTENTPPTVDAGRDRTTVLSDDLRLEGTASYHTLGGKLTSTWLHVRGPGEAIFTDPRNLKTTVKFSTPGAYLLRLSASDGAQSSDSNVTVTVLPAK